jgi:hypothetical protein
VKRWRERDAWQGCHRTERTLSELATAQEVRSQRADKQLSRSESYSSQIKHGLKDLKDRAVRANLDSESKKTDESDRQQAKHDDL